MLRFELVKVVDEQLCAFHQRQTDYYQIEKLTPTKEYLINDMHAPDGFDQNDHVVYKVFDDDSLVSIIDYQKGYRYSMLHDDDNIWIGLFLVDENYQRKGLGTKIINQFIEKWQSQYKSIQLACIKDNQKGLAFWHSLGFEKIGCSKYRDLDVIVLQRNL
ncbi:N-acetyltransferase [uncultured Thomasclavelia sp.]|uniref:GNAT family N-acetyltransferase n=1 Tax=uncultured Thomasclavelia sp. TaxID=3025759 RepID=UPI00260CA36F|nr:GNAT family N-acetyltransferase [uncultured Thomasclavelia sp.]